MRILVTGSSGLIGSMLVPRLTSRGNEVLRLVRRPSSSGFEISWDPESGRLSPQEIEGFEAVVHLAGDPIAHGRWTSAKKERIRNSRVNGTALLARTLAGLSRPPKVLLCASAIGYYGNRGNEPLDESSRPGSGFLAETGKEWEQAAEPAKKCGIRVVALRFGIVMSSYGGALALMLKPFKLGLGGALGSGTQQMSWVSIEDVIGAIFHAIDRPEISGPVNVVSPNPVTNAEFTRALGRAVRRPALIPVPAFAARMLFGEMADEALLASARVYPKRLLDTGYRFRHPELVPALHELLARSAPA